MTDKAKLKDMLDAIIDGNDEQAHVSFHGYVTDKMREMIHPPVDDASVENKEENTPTE